MNHEIRTRLESLRCHVVAAETSLDEDDHDAVQVCVDRVIELAEQLRDQLNAAPLQTA